MSKGERLQRIFIIAAAVLAALFLTILFLSVPFGSRASVLPVTALYIAGGIAAGGFFAAAVVFFLRSRQGS